MPSRAGDTLVIGLKNSTDSLQVQNYFYSNGTSTYAVENLRFADGTNVVGPLAGR